MPENRYVIGGLVIGGFASIIQALVLRRWIAFRTLWWTIAGAVGGGAGYTLGVIAFLLIPYGLAYLNVDIPMSLERAAGGAVGGAALGFIQWFFLRRESTRGGLWVVANALGYGIAVPIFWNLWIGETLRYAAMGAVAAVITGTALAFVLKLPNEPQNVRPEIETSGSEGVLRG